MELLDLLDFESFMRLTSQEHMNTSLYSVTGRIIKYVARRVWKKELERQTEEVLGGRDSSVQQPIEMNQILCLARIAL